MLLVIGCYWSLDVTGRWMLLVAGCYWSLDVTGRWMLLVTGSYWSLDVTGHWMLSNQSINLQISLHSITIFSSHPLHVLLLDLVH
jgi:hypothetical protein